MEKNNLKGCGFFVLSFIGFLFLGSISARAETLFYASFDKSLAADVSVGEAAPIGTDAAVITVFTELTKGGKGVKKPGTEEVGEALDLASERGKTAEISYESSGNINTSQGTIQFWVYPMFDIWPLRGKDSTRKFFSLKMQGGQYNGIYLAYRDWYYDGINPTAPIIALQIEINDGKSYYAHWDLRKIGWRKGVWQHVMACWDKESTRLYINGAQVRKIEFTETAPYKPTPPDGPIVIGQTGKDLNAPFLLDELRIDDRPLVGADVTKFDPWSLPGIEKKTSDIVYRPQIPCARISVLPTIDGNLSEEVWKSAIKVGGFTALNSIGDFRFVDIQTYLQACYDEKNLYLGFTSFEPYMEKLSAPVREHDGEVWHDDAIEAFICPEKENPKLYYQFIANASGSTYDGKGSTNSSWNGLWDVKTSKNQDKWFVEMAIPWETLEVSAPSTGSALPFNAARDRYILGGELSSLASVGSSFNMTNNFGNLCFIDKRDELGSENKINSFFIQKVSSDCRRKLEVIRQQLQTADSFQVPADSREAKELAELKSALEPLAKVVAKPMGVEDCVRAINQFDIFALKAEEISIRTFATTSLSALKSPGKDVVVIGEKNRFVIHKKSGILLGITDDTGNIICRSAIDRYTFETKDKKKISFDEIGDRVIEDSFQVSNNQVQTLCLNANAPEIEIKKTYTLISDKILVKRVEFKNSGEKEYKVSGVTRVTLDNGFRKEGLYSRLPCAIAYVNEKYLTLADEVKSAIPLRKSWVDTSGAGLVVFTNKERTLGLAQYQTRINDKLVFLPDSTFEMSFLTPEGWSLAWFVAALKGNSSVSCEMRYHIFDGNRMRFYQEHRETTGIKEAWKDWEPGRWASRIKFFNAFAWFMKPEIWQPMFDNQLKTLTETYSAINRPGDLVLLMTKGISYWWGNLPVSDSSVVSGWDFNSGEASTFPVSAYAPRFWAASKDDSLFRLGNYGWPSSIALLPGSSKEHPEWFLHNQKGELIGCAVPEFEAVCPSYNINHANNDVVEWLTDQIIQSADYFKTTMVYTDGSRPGTAIDWATMTMSSSTDISFAKRLWEKCRKRDIIYFANDDYVMTPYKDVVFIETVTWPWEDWKANVSQMAVAKLYANPYVPSFLLYWNEANNLDMINTGVLLGLRGVQPPYSYRIAESYMTTAHEMYGYGLVDVGLTPCYWMEETDIETYSLQREGDKGILITLRNHRKEPADITLSFDAEKAGLDIKKPFYAWYLDAKSFDELKANPSPELFVTKDIREQIAVSKGRIRIMVKDVVPEVAKQIYITNIPAFVWGIAGKPTQVKAANVLATSIEQEEDNLFGVLCERDSSILYVLPERKSLKVLMDGKEINTRESSIGTTPVLLFTVPAGKHNIRIR